MSSKCNKAFKEFILIYKEVSLKNLELYFKNVTIKFYIKCIDTNKLLPCIYNENNLKTNSKPRKCSIVYVIGNYLIAPLTHSLSGLKLKTSNQRVFVSCVNAITVICLCTVKIVVQSILSVYLIVKH